MVNTWYWEVTEQIAYARATVRNLIAADKTGDVVELELAVSWLNTAELKCRQYGQRRDGIDRLPDD